ncbi:uncharacterized protein B0I36DRAFT_61949 [Microdochium trichocladiopsis]|uniref:UBX domain-containing protein 2 n=1 Tax=Microdochium trichocladiopsis TaxID=1682393 RepID=A0A9P8YFS4_9PEZI|nr:uncharacterized protein B0I36DRAFT_61949 [Microdochium trichocladiopsis]KAH7037118.1 hypothetical protein B0I36DRAFT_61949 [Microdochium trichocladiopsis]
MFYEGSLQEAIQSAVQQSKLVVCFVTDDEPESIRWEAEYLTDEAIKDKLTQSAVVLRLVAGTEEAGFLEALFPIPRKPTLVMIHNGQLKEYIAPNVTKEVFLQRAKTALDSTPAAPSSQTQVPQTGAPASTAQAPAQQSSTPTRQEDGNDDLYGDASPLRASTGAPGPSSSAPTAAERQAAQNQAILAERAKRLEADKKAKDAKDKAEREARAKARKASDDTGGSAGAQDATEQQQQQQQNNQRNIKPAERKHAQEVRQQKIQDREHRQRILKRIEDDRRERKEKDAQERQARLLLNATSDDTKDAAASAAASIPLTTRLTESTSSGKGKSTAHCNLQVRLFDGSTMRARFPSDSKLGTDVRTWIDEERTDGNAPYTFRIVLTPLPNKAVSKPEETDETLESLGLAPSATLVLVPVSYAAAYAANPRGDVLGRLLWPIFMLLGSGFHAIVGILRSLFGGAGGDAASAARAMGDTTNNNSDADEPASSRMRGDDDDGEIRERKTRKKGKKAEGGETNLYNGNSLSFEPRKDSDDDEDEE